MGMLTDFNFADNAQFIIPFFMYALSILITFSVRQFDFVYLWTRDIPRLGSEFCKIACALILGAFALGLSSTPLRNSWLGRRADHDVLGALMLALFVALFVGSYSCFYKIEGKRTWRSEMTVFRWLACWVAGQSFGLVAIWIATSALSRKSP